MCVCVCDVLCGVCAYSCPRYYLLPSLVQKNLLVLLSRCSGSIPLPTAIEFLNALRNASQNDRWVHYLLSKLFRLLKESEMEQKGQIGLQETTSEAICIALSDTLVGKISDLGRRFIALKPSTCTGMRSDTITIIDVNSVTGVKEQDATVAANDVPNQSKGHSQATCLAFEDGALIGKKRNRSDDGSPGKPCDLFLVICTAYCLYSLLQETMMILTSKEYPF